VAAALLLVGCADAPASLGDPMLDAGRATYGQLCSTCHGPTGEGLSAPSLTGVLATFPDCEDHRRWVSLGSMEWERQFGPTYGATSKEITAIMPSFKNVLSEAEIAEVAAFERFQFAGSSVADAVDGCGGN
jgi:mono/diheme cytochrome c family protein